MCHTRCNITGTVAAEEITPKEPPELNAFLVSSAQGEKATITEGVGFACASTSDRDF